MLAISLKHNIYVKFLEMLLDNDVTSSCARHVRWQRNNHSDVRDRRHITFVTFNRFCPLGKPPPTPPLSLMDMSNWWNTNQNWMKNTRLFYTAFQVFKALLIENYKTQLLVLFISCCFIKLLAFRFTHTHQFLLQLCWESPAVFQGPCWSSIFWTFVGKYKTVIYRFPIRSIRNNWTEKPTIKSIKMSEKISLGK